MLRDGARWTAIGVTAVLLGGCSDVQQDADAEAARVADHVLPAAADEVLTSSRATTSERRGAVAEAWFSEPDAAVTDSQGASTWVVRSRDGASLRVDVYRRVESASFFPPDRGESAWGLACRTYDVASTVTATPVDCPAGTPKAP